MNRPAGHMVLSKKYSAIKSFISITKNYISTQKTAHLPKVTMTLNAMTQTYTPSMGHFVFFYTKL